jgi:PAS domain S-box-containing protein
VARPPADRAVNGSYRLLFEVALFSKDCKFMLKAAKLLQGIMTTSDDAIVVTSPDGLIDEWNPAAERLLGYRADEIIGRPMRALFPDAWWPFYDDRLEALKQGHTVHCDSVRRHKNGSLVDVNVTSSGLFDEQGRFLCHFSLFKDLQAMRSQDLANAFLASIVRASPDAIMSTDVDFKISTWNEAAETMFRRTIDDVRGKLLFEVIPDLTRHAAMFQVEQPSRRKFERREAFYEQAEGRPMIVETTVTSLLNGAGVPTGWSITCSDITEKKRKEEHDRFMLRELSHRAKNLLAVIMAMFRNSAEAKTSLAEFEEDFSARIQGLAKSHDLLVQNQWQGASLHGLVDAQLLPFLGTPHQLAKSGPDVALSPAAVQCIGIALHELATNAVKHGALSCARGRILVETHRCAAHLHLKWTETGGPSVDEPSRIGFGRSVLEDMIADATGGEAQLVFASTGVQWSAKIPAALIAD